jgi:tetratricopeptide (TPR) repeat protein
MNTLEQQLETSAIAEESVRRWRSLAAVNSIFQADLARALSNLAITEHNRSRYQEALASAEESVGLLQPVATGNHDIQNDLANTLLGLSDYLGHAGRRDESLTAKRDAVRIFGALAHAEPDLYQETYQRTLAELRRTDDLREDHWTSEQ